MNIEIYSKNNCIYCTKIKELFNFHGICYDELSLDDGHTKEEIQERVGDVKKINTVPQVFVNGEYLGGYLETVEFIAYDMYHD
jgi:glutaredoxin